MKNKTFKFNITVTAFVMLFAFGGIALAALTFTEDSGDTTLTPADTVNIGGNSLVLSSLSSAPSSPSAGQTYFDTSLDQYWGHNGTEWVPLSDPAFPTDNLVSYWKLDEGSGNASDSQGSNTLTNNGAAYVVSKINNGGDIENSGGEDQYFAIADGSQSGLDFGGDFSASFWVRLESLSAAGSVMAKDASDSHGYNIAFQSTDGRILVEFWDGNTNPDDLTFFRSDPDVVKTGVWDHYAITVDVSVPTVKMYKNGEEITSNSVNTNATTLQDSSGDFAIGRQGSFDLSYLDGIFDEVGVWGDVLSSTEVEALYNSSKGLSL